MSNKGKAIFFLGVGEPLEAREYPLPEELEPEAILVKTKMATVCGSDMHSWRGRRPFPTPSVLGHEGVGNIIRLGDAVQRDTAGQSLAVGDRITWTIMAACGHCTFCRVHGLEQKCLDLFKYGHVVSDEPPYFLGTFGEYVYLKPGTGVFKLPAEMPDETASPLMCAAATVVGGLDKAGVNPGDTVVIQGAGMLGLYASAFAKAMGAGQVIMVDVLDKRLEVASHYGADALLNAEKMGPDELVEAVKKQTGGLGADLVIEVAGFAAVVEVGVKMLRIGGRYLMHGAVYPDDHFKLQSHDVIIKCLSLYGLHNYGSKHLGMALNLVLQTQDRYPYTELAGPRFPLTAKGVTDALLALENREAIRPIVVPGS
jgi:L-iditol 2-dehydrogenase